MATHTDHSFPHLKNLSRPMSELLADPLSELTRKRRQALMIVATIALLLSAGLVNVKEVGVADVKFELLLPHLATWLAVAITGYLLISYILVVWADWAIVKTKRWSPFAKIGDVKAKMDEDHQARMRAGKVRSEEAHRLIDELHKVEAEIRARRVLLAQESDELVRESAESALDGELRDRTAPLLHASGKSVQSISLEEAQSESAERGDIEETIRTFSRLTQLRLVFEIFFPAAYALFALAWTVLHA